MHAGLLFVALLAVSRPSLSSGDTAHTVVQAPKTCAAGCEKRGNCNQEDGTCECPWGYTGPTCNVDRMAACRQTPDDPGSCGFLFPKNCECYRECYRLYCGRYGTDTDKCVGQWGQGSLRNSPCYLYGASHEEAMARPQNSSRYPEDAPRSTVWYREIPDLIAEDGKYQKFMILQDESRKYISPWDRPGLSWHRAPHKAHPLSHCPANCSNGRGVCLQYDGRDTPECACHVGYNGTDCAGTDASEACWFAPDCGGRGTCVAGFCHCRPGHWGMGCARSGAYRPAPGVPEGALPDVRPLGGRLKIYKYELPWEVAFPYELNEWTHTRDPMYSAYEQFLKLFLQDNATRTENPYEAHLFYVPLLAFFYVENVRNPRWQAEAVLDYVRTRWPFFNRTDGRDHFWFATGDRGPCHAGRWLQDHTIKVVNFGMQRANLSWNGIDNQDYGCIQVKRDLVVPPHPADPRELRPEHTAAYYEWLTSNGGRDGNRTLLFFFAGGVRQEPEYGGGARMALKKLLDSLQPAPPDVRFAEGRTDDYTTLLRTSNFCMAPYGHGWGIRAMQAVHFGCIPVIIQDGVYQAFEDFLPYEEFSVRLPLRDIPRAVEILRGYTPHQLAALRLGLSRAHRAFIWEREWGGRAYEWTLAGLQRRAQAAAAGHFRRRRRGQR